MKRKLAVTLDSDVYEEIRREARRLHMGPSALVALALAFALPRLRKRGRK